MEILIAMDTILFPFVKLVHVFLIYTMDMINGFVFP